MKYVFFAVSLLMLSACSHTTETSPAALGNSERTFTLGLVQREIRPGMSQAAVAEALGSPNIVSKDDSGQEVWIYDKIASEASYRSSRTNAGILGGVGGMAGSVLLLGIPSFNYDAAEANSTSSERTLTVVIKFNSSQQVRDASYHSSRF